MASPNCVEVDAALRSGEESRRFYYLEDAKLQVNAIIGDPNDTMLRYLYAKNLSDNLKAKGNAAHKRLHDMLMQELADVGELTDYTLDPRNKLLGLSDYIFATHGYIGHVKAVSRFPRQYISLEKTIAKLLKVQKRVGEQGLSRWERAYIPLSLFSIRSDRFGDMYSFAKRATQLKENSIQASVGFAGVFKEANSGLGKHIDTILGQVKMLTAEYLVGGVEMNYKGQEITLIDAGYDENKIPIYIYRDENGNENDVPIADLNKKAVSNAVTRHWQYVVADKLMQGEMRYVVFRDKAEGEDLDKLMTMFTEIAAYRKIDESRPRPHIQYVFDPVQRISYGYMMVKSEEGAFDENEHYRAYPVVMQKEGKNPQLLYDPGNTAQGIAPRYARGTELLGVANISVMQEGFYHSTAYSDYGPILNKWMKPIKGSSNRKYADFEYMPKKIEDDIHNIGVQPNMDVMFYDRVGGVGASHSLFQMLRMKRGNYSSIFKDASRRGKNLTKQGKDLIAEFKNLTGQENASMKEVLESLENMLDMNTNIYIDKNDEIVMQMSHFNQKGESYAPTMYKKLKMWDMLAKAEGDIYRRLQELAGSNEDATEENAAYKAIKRNYALSLGLDAESEYAGLQSEYDSRMPLQNLVQHAKHKSAWADPRERRRDSRVEHDYLNSVYSTLAKQQLMIEMLRGVNATLKTTEDPLIQEGIIDWYVNRTKISVGDISAKAVIPLPFGGEVNLGYEQVAAANRRYGLPGLRNSTPESIQNSVLFTRSMLSSKLLGIWVALGNRMQSSNTFYHYGSRIFFQAMNEMEDTSPNGKGEFWAHITNVIGTDSIVSAFVENVASAATISFGDMAWFGSNVPNPRVLKDLIKTYAQSRTDANKFVRDGVPELDEYFKQLLEAQPKKEKFRAVIKEAHRQGHRGHNLIKAVERMEQRILKAPEPAMDQLQRLRDMRQAFLDLLLMEKPDNWEYLNKEIENRVTKKEMQDFEREEQNMRFMIERYRVLLGDVSSDMMRRVVAAKLGWFLGKGEWFTMSEGEGHMRKVDAIASLMMADAMGALTEPGSTTVNIKRVEDGNEIEGQLEIHNRFLSPTAIHIARMSVNNNMFGMIPTYLGDSFSGVGNLVFQWKAYVLQQTIRDYNAVRSMMRGSDFLGQGVARAIGQAVQMGVEKRSGEGYNPQGAIDHEARMFVRWFATRATASFFQSIVGMIRHVPIIKDLTTGRVGYSLLNGGESPVLTVMLNLVIKSAMYISYIGDDDMDKDIAEAFWDILMLVFPPILSMFLQGIYKATEKLIDD